MSYNQASLTFPQPATQPQHPTTQPQHFTTQAQHPTTQPQHPFVQSLQLLDLTSSAFYPPTQTSLPSNLSQDSMKPYINFMSRRANKVEKFFDQPGNYQIWKKFFQNMIRHVNIMLSEEISFITEYTTKNSKKLVQQLHSAYIKNPAKGVKEVWKKLDERFRTSIVLTKAHLQLCAKIMRLFAFC